MLIGRLLLGMSCASFALYTTYLADVSDDRNCTRDFILLEIVHLN
ncbi:hypothetical protein [Bartonella harrusi]|nr:hypothetical protein [Bartonella harrusi]